MASQKTLLPTRDCASTMLFILNVILLIFLLYTNMAPQNVLPMRTGDVNVTNAPEAANQAVQQCAGPVASEKHTTNQSIHYDAHRTVGSEKRATNESVPAAAQYTQQIPNSMSSSERFRQTLSPPEYRVLSSLSEMVPAGDLFLPGSAYQRNAWRSAAEQNGFSMYLPKIKDQNYAIPESEFVSRVSYRRENKQQVCRAEFACFNATHILFVAKDNQVARNITAHNRECCNPGNKDVWTAEKCSRTDMTAWNLCRCFPSSRFYPGFIDLAEAMTYPLLPNMTWFSNHWMPPGSHHPDHFAMKIVEYHTYHSPAMADFQLPHADNLLMQDYYVPLTSWEELVLNISLASHPKTVNLIGGNVFSEHNNLYRGTVCAENAVWIPAYGTPFTSDLNRTGPYWKMALDDYFERTGFQDVKRGQTDCPPPRAVILHRVEGSTLRRIRNLDEVKGLFHKLGISIVDDVTVSSIMNGTEQAHIFRSFGLMITSHSSQLSNLLYAKRNAAVIELNTVYYQDVFKRAAQPMQLWYNISAGHEPADDRLKRMFNEECDPFLPSQFRYKYIHTRHPEYPHCESQSLILDDYYVNIEYLEASLRNALQHLNTVCGGEWFDETLAVQNRPGLISPEVLGRGVSRSAS